MFFLSDRDNDAKVILVANRSSGFASVARIPNFIGAKFFFCHWPFKPSENASYGIIVEYLKKMFVSDYHGCALPYSHSDCQGPT